MRILRNAVIYVAIAFAAFFLQTTLMHKIALASVAPNLLVVVTAVFGSMLDSKKGMLMGFLCGLWCDIFYGSFLGMYALIYVVVGYASGTIRHLIFDDDVNLPVIIIILSDVIYGVIMYVLFFFLRTRFQILYYTMHVIIPEAVYTGILGILVYRVFLLVRRQLDTIEKRSAGKFV